MKMVDKRNLKYLTIQMNLNYLPVKNFIGSFIIKNKCRNAFNQVSVMENIIYPLDKWNLGLKT